MLGGAKTTSPRQHAFILAERMLRQDGKGNSRFRVSGRARGSKRLNAGLEYFPKTDAGRALAMLLISLVAILLALIRVAQTNKK